MFSRTAPTPAHAFIKKKFSHQKVVFQLYHAGLHQSIINIRRWRRIVSRVDHGGRRINKKAGGGGGGGGG
ncbi:hypothetical protein ACVGWQ_02680, partial [Enterobacter hormaechei]